MAYNPQREKTITCGAASLIEDGANDVLALAGFRSLVPGQGAAAGRG
ncbi:MAG: hypothetical protein IH864_07920 [Chloroflexi bacterium]|nr:hypothetical protein [Chloroflexota bacterium]